MADGEMKVNVYFGRYGSSFFCSTCGQRLKDSVNGVLRHKSQKGMFIKRPSECQFVGKSFRDPFVGMKLEAVNG